MMMTMNNYSWQIYMETVNSNNKIFNHKMYGNFCLFFLLCGKQNNNNQTFLMAFERLVDVPYVIRPRSYA